MKRRTMFSLTAGVVVGAALPALAQTQRVMRMGVLAIFPVGDEEFRLALRQLGWEIGRNLTVESRYSKGDTQLFPSLARELVDLRVDMILTLGDFATGAAFNATRTIPIVAMAIAPVEQGWAKSLARPGGNVTGTIYQAQDYAGRELDILRAILPDLSRIGVVFIESVGVRTWFAAWQSAADKAGVTIVRLPSPQRVADIAATLAVASRERVQAIEFGLNPVLNGAGWRQINAWAVENKVLTKASARSEAAVAFGANASKMMAPLAAQVDRVLRGASPADMPIQQPTEFELIINRKLIRAIGLTVPQSVLLQATEVID